MPNNKKNTKSRMLSVEETNAALDKEFAEQNPKAEDLAPKQGESKALEESLQTSSVAAEKAEETVPDVTSVGSDGRPLLNTKGAISLTTVTSQMRTRERFKLDLLATQKKDSKTRPYSWKTSRG